MCGLTGVFGGNLSYREMYIFQKLASLSDLRGEDSTGFMDYIHGDKTPTKFIKTLDIAGHVFGERSFFEDQFIYKRYAGQKKCVQLLAAHARAATIGKVNKHNAHPFQHGHIIGMHNGTINPEFRHRKEFETDSEAIFYNMAKHGEEDTLLMLDDLAMGAYTLTWINTKEKTFNIIRNGERPLYVVGEHATKAMYYSSDDNFLRAVLPYYKINGHPQTVPVDMWYKYDLTVENVAEAKTEKRIKNKKFWEAKHWQGNQREAPFETSMTKPSGNVIPMVAGPTNKEIKIDDKPYLVKRIHSQTRGPSGENCTWYELAANQSVSESRMAYLVSKGCAGCGCVPDKNADTFGVMADKETIMCQDCMEDETMLALVSYEVRNEMAERHPFRNSRT